MKDWQKIIAFVFLLLPSPTTFVKADGESRVAVIGYASNYSSFKFYREKFKTTGAEADSLEAALAGRWHNLISAETLHVVDGVFERIEQDAGAAGLPSPPKMKSDGKATQVTTTTSSTFVNQSYLSGESGSLNYTNALKVADLMENDDPALVSGLTLPMSIDLVGPRNVRGPDWMQANPDVLVATELGRQTIDGLSLIGMRYTKPNSVEGYEFWFDPARGYLPIRATMTMADKRVKRVYVRECKECGNGRWFPTRILAVTPKKSEGGVRLREMHVLELDTDNKPKSDDFAIDLPAGTILKLRKDMSASIVLKQDERVNARDLPGLFEKVTRAPSEPYADTALTPPSHSTWKVFTLLGLGVLLSGVGVAWAIRRRRRPPEVNAGA